MHCHTPDEFRAYSPAPANESGIYPLRNLCKPLRTNSTDCSRKGVVARNSFSSSDNLLFKSCPVHYKHSSRPTQSFRDLPQGLIRPRTSATSRVDPPNLPRKHLQHATYNHIHLYSSIIRSFLRMFIIQWCFHFQKLIF